MVNVNQADHGRLDLGINHYRNSIWFGEVWSYRDIADIVCCQHLYRIKVKSSIVWNGATSDNRVKYSRTITSVYQSILQKFVSSVSLAAATDNRCRCQIPSVLHRSMSIGKRVPRKIFVPEWNAVSCGTQRI